MKKKRRKKSDIAKAQKRLWERVKVYVRLRDNNTCQWCSKKVSGSNAHTSHVVPKSSGNILKFDVRNLKVLCMYCHLQKWHKDPILANLWFKNKFPERYDYLQEQRNIIVKWYASDYEDMIVEVEDKIIGIEIQREVEDEEDCHIFSD